MKFNFKDESKKINSELKEIQRKITKCEEFLFAEGRKREDLLQQLISAKGLQAQELSLKLAQCSEQVTQYEENLMSHMEQYDEWDRKLQELRQKSSQNQ